MSWKPGDLERRACSRDGTPGKRTWTNEELADARRVLLQRSRWRHSLEAISQNKLAVALVVMLLGSLGTACCSVVRAYERLDVEKVSTHVSAGDVRDKAQDDEIAALNSGMERVTRLLETADARAGKRDELTARMLANQEGQGKQLDRVVGLVDEILKERRRASQ